MNKTKNTRGWVKSMIVAMVIGIALGFAPQVESQDKPDPGEETCHDGDCQLAGCGDTTATPCTYMDCGGGTELCMKD